ncbi:MAG: putative selenate reductase subunit YgfK [Oscillospiraceae bacterium]|nr:putative selenate reductase subunit YgfK [Oscillospiraceae bacterium]
MSDIMRPMSFGHLMNWILEEYENSGSIFGVSKLVRHSDGKALPMFKEKIESPYGPAAGPHTQLAQNIIAAYVAGARFFELKTVQIMDGEELSKCVSKPCITAVDECYNCEWSTELTVPQAYGEYVKAWFACKVLAKELDLGDPDGFVFNMSVGYDLAGIKSEKIDRYIEEMKDASGTGVWRACMDWLNANLSRFQKVDSAFVQGISPRVSESITESTLHGCPPDEIERIATYLITEKNLNTYVKCNPTLLGYGFARSTLDSLGFDYIVFDNHHFLEDLQWKDAVPMFRRLMALTAERGLEFGVKLTNTFPVDVAANELPSEEMYMSGRSLYPLTLSLAAMLTREFEGKLRISYSGGADALSIRALFDAGIWPITIATAILKPGRYQRLSQIGGKLMEIPYEAWKGVDLNQVTALVEAIPTTSRWKKPAKPVPSRKTDQKVPLIDCFQAPCRSGCPIEQDIPAYLAAVEAGTYEEALEIITQRNPLPFITGTICSHRYQDKCMRGGYEESVHIRAQKLKAAEGGFAALLPKLKPAAPVAGKKAAVIGGGPGGMAAAFFLARAGVSVTLFEQKDALGGIVRHVIPEFRISHEAIDSDEKLLKAMGVQVKLNTRVQDTAALFNEYTHVILATGAWNKGSAGLEYGGEMNVIAFLEAAKKQPDSLKLGEHVVVIGGGNTAMDAARAAKRIPGVKNVSLVYRRTKRYMPASQEELELAEADGVAFRELLAPVGVKDGVLTCKVMELGAPDASGRRSPVDTGRTEEIPADTVITAVGERVDTGLYTSNGLQVDERGKAVVNPETMESSVPHLYVVGDGQKGPGTVVEAIAGAAKAAKAIQDFALDTYTDRNVNSDYKKPLASRGELCGDCASCGENRCLGCATVCETCAEVCPNRANVPVAVPGMRQRQIVHVDGMCNECGNCAAFCPYSSRPYKDKFTLFWSREDFDNSENPGFLKLDGGKTLVRLGGSVKEYDVASAACGLYDPLRRLICAVYENYSYLLK